jgi:hypothetical protein
MISSHDDKQSVSSFQPQKFRVCLVVMLFVALFGIVLFAAFTTAQADSFQNVPTTDPVIFGDIAWTQIVSGMNSLNCRTMTMNPVTPTILFAATEWGDFRSIDSGSNWELIRSNDPYPSLGDQFVVDTMNPSRVYLLEYGILKSEDNGNTWQDLSGDLTYAYDAVTLAPSPISSTILFVGLRGDISGNWGAYRTLNGGAHWEKINSLPHTAINHIVIEPGNPNRMYAATWLGLYVSNDAGETWSAVAGLSKASYSIAVSPILTTVLYVGAIDGVYKSVNHGENWGKISPIAYSFLTTDPIDAGTVYVSDSIGVSRSTDFGETWQTVFSASASPFGVIVDRQDQKHGRLYVCNFGSLYDGLGVYAGTMLLYKAYLPITLR